MGFLAETARAHVQGLVVRGCFLVQLDFASETMRLHQGTGTLVTGGQSWIGLGRLGSISGIESAIGGTAPKVTFALSGVDPTHTAKALDAQDEVRGRNATVYAAFFTDALQPLDAPYAVWAGTMDTIAIDMKGATERVVTLDCETVFARRAFPPWGWLSDRHQQKIYPGDKGLEFVPKMVNATAEWPPA